MGGWEGLWRERKRAKWERRSEEGTPGERGNDGGRCVVRVPVGGWDVGRHEWRKAAWKATGCAVTLKQARKRQAEREGGATTAL